MEKELRGVIYARFSSAKQRETSIAGQIRECRAYAESKGIAVVGTYEDRAVSGRSDRRPAFRRLLEDAGAHRFDIVIVWKADRLARNRLIACRTREFLRKNGIGIASATENFGSGAQAAISESLADGMAEFYSLDLGEKTKRGQMEGFLSRRFNGGKPPVGFRVGPDKRLIVCPPEASAIRKAIRLIAKKGATLADAADFLRRQIPGRNWTLRNVVKTIKNRKLIGEGRLGNKTMAGWCPAIVPERDFLLANGRIASAEKRNKASRPACRAFPLSGIARCPNCDGKLTGSSGKSHTGKLFRYYRCAFCKAKPVPKAKLEAKAWQKIRRHWPTAALLRKAFPEVFGVDAAQTAKKRIRAAQQRIRRLLDAIEGGNPGKAIARRISDIEADIERESSLAKCLGRKKAAPHLTLDQKAAVLRLGMTRIEEGIPAPVVGQNVLQSR